MSCALVLHSTTPYEITAIVSQIEFPDGSLMSMSVEVTVAPGT